MHTKPWIIRQKKEGFWTTIILMRLIFAKQLKKVYFIGEYKYIYGIYSFLGTNLTRDFSLLIYYIFFLFSLE
jgi:uncharacterized membrane protein